MNEIKEALLVAVKVGVEGNAEKTKCIFMSLQWYEVKFNL
jgi:hypothetical protein